MQIKIIRKVEILHDEGRIFYIGMLCKAFLDGLVDTMGHTHLLCHFHLHHPFTVSAPPEPVRYIIDFLISAILLIKMCSLQNLPWGAHMHE